MNSNKKDSQKFLILVFDIVAIIVLISIFVLAITHKGPGNLPKSDQISENGISSNISASADNLLASDESDELDTLADSKQNKTTISDNSTSDNSVSEDSISDNSLSDNSVSDNTLYSYALPNVPTLLNSPSGTVTTLSQINTSEIGSYFVITNVPDDIYEYINGKSFQPGGAISIDELRYIKLIHFNFDHNIQVGELIVNASVADEMRSIFLSLFCKEYEIQSMYLPDRYWTGDGNTTDSASCDANNTSAFFYRTVDGTSKLSNHAYGKAIDINPQQNPYVGYSTGVPVCEHENALAYIDRTTGLPHMINETDLCYQLFASYGYKWGGSWTSPKDYQHFEK